MASSPLPLPAYMHDSTTKSEPRINELVCVGLTAGTALKTSVKNTRWQWKDGFEILIKEQVDRDRMDLKAWGKEFNSWLSKINGMLSTLLLSPLLLSSSTRSRDSWPTKMLMLLPQPSYLARYSVRASSWIWSLEKCRRERFTVLCQNLPLRQW